MRFFNRLKEKRKKKVTKYFMGEMNSLVTMLPVVILQTPLESCLTAYEDILNESGLKMDSDDERKMVEFFRELQVEAEENTEYHLHIFSIPSIALEISKSEKAKEFFKETDPKKIEEALYWLKGIKE